MLGFKLRPEIQDRVAKFADEVFSSRLPFDLSFSLTDLGEKGRFVLHFYIFWFIFFFFFFFFCKVKYVHIISQIQAQYLELKGNGVGWNKELALPLLEQALEIYGGILTSQPTNAYIMIQHAHLSLSISKLFFFALVQTALIFFF
jgi:hypothetical protein